ncbi:very short patch repair endonuclease [Phreatobacter sp. AB_2022a]|uniref:very short patch repair endonuclease n=1 Tax=Phreatobacter sp. AB_2022a TaxID=3003134 RepID=UPI002286E478|nr:DNA mismatch endonuclease Vsr [Phreatobacter sp. AB_2022a]MCZ0735679.1 DNA mismatch endonuclease Vsr [Phreatobacter sp. AB_2022a]
MVDTLSEKARSERMARILGKNTGPEMIVRRLVHGLGYRYRLHGKHLCGRPDLVFAKRRKVIFVHGCFWHRHDDSACKLARLPKSRLEFWLPKLTANAERDKRNVAELTALGWDVMTIWECELNDLTFLGHRIQAFLR